MGHTRKKTLAIKRSSALALIERDYRSQAARLAKTRRIFGRRVYVTDIHTHSYHSDGSGSVDDNMDVALERGLDFMFATDHFSIAQRRRARRLRRASWGQEPGAGLHHIGLLMNKKKFTPRQDSIAADFARAQEASAFAWIPHPVGWFHQMWYSDAQIESLWTLGDEFAMEVINGAGKTIRGYDQFDAKAVRTWDRLLCSGRRVHALGGSDAHSPVQVGACWTGVYAKSLSAKALAGAMAAGSCFASECPLLDLSCDGKPMGSVLRKRKGSQLRLCFRVADSVGLASVRVVSGGKVIQEFRPEGEALLEAGLSRKVGARKAYYRLECTAVDDRRAFSTPVFIEPR